MHVISDYGMANDHKENYYQIDSIEIHALKDNLTALSTINLKDGYGFGYDKPTDLPVSVYRYETNIKSDSTSIYFPGENELPDELLSFISLLNRIINETDTLLVR